MKCVISLDDEPNLYNLLKDYESSTERSSIKIKKTKVIEIIINAKDPVSLRAAFNSITKLITVFKNMESV